MFELVDRIRAIKRFIAVWRRDEDGAVTVDWVVLTAAVVGLAFLVVASFGTALSGLSTELSTHISEFQAGVNY